MEVEYAAWCEEVGARDLSEKAFLEVVVVKALR